MALIINELITVVETPAGPEREAPQASGGDELERKQRDWLELSREREARLNCD